MKMQDVIDAIYEPIPKGYRVHFEWCGNGFLRTDYFPDVETEEAPLETEEGAWYWAERFAKAMKGRVCNLYVVDENFRPVGNASQRQIVNR